MKNLLQLSLILFCLITTAQSDGQSPEQFSQDLAIMTQDLTIANDCNNPERLKIKRDTLNMNFHTLELMNVELHVRKIINQGEIIHRCGSVTIDVSQNRQEHSSLEVNYYSNVYGYTAEIINDNIHFNSKNKIAAIKIINPENNSSYWHSEYDQNMMKISLRGIPKGNYIVALSINQSFIVNILNHHQKSKKP